VEGKGGREHTKFDGLICSRQKMGEYHLISSAFFHSSAFGHSEHFSTPQLLDTDQLSILPQLSSTSIDTACSSAFCHSYLSFLPQFSAFCHSSQSCHITVEEMTLKAGY
jgi:hypothetical protein